MNKVSALLLVAILVAGVFEAAVLGVAYASADEVECTSIGPVPVYCTFTDRVKTEIERSQSCYINGEKVNCSEMENFSTDFMNGGGGTR